jgi:hypothetical protein
VARALLLPPERLRAHHDLGGFANGKHPYLDAWLKDRALVSKGLSARTYVICRSEAPEHVVGYYAISTAMEERTALSSAVAADRPTGLGCFYPWPRFWGRSSLRCDPPLLAASDIAGVRAIVAHAIDDQTVRFYQHHGFVPSPLGERVMLLAIETARAALGS